MTNSKTYLNDLKRIFNRSLREVERVDRLILKSYKESLKSIKKEIDAYRFDRDMAFGYKNPKNIATANEVRLTLLYQQVSKEITQLSNKNARLIESGYVTNYKDTYYRTSYVTEKEINKLIIQGTIKVSSIEGGSISLSFPILNTNAVRESFNEVIAGETFKQRTIADRKALQSRIQKLVAKAVIEGQSAKDLQKAITKLDDSYLSNAGSAQSTARTELLKAHSLGDELSNFEAVKAGVEYNYEWDASLDSKTRPAHARADGKRAKNLDGLPAFYIGQNIMTSPRLLHPKNTANGVGNVINCRCRRLNLPYGIAPTRRIQKLDDEWKEVDKNKSYDLWLADMERQGIKK